MYYYLAVMLALLVAGFTVSKINSQYRKGLILISAAACTVYIVWRLSAIPLHSGWVSLILGILLYLAEIIGLISFFNFQFLFMGNYKIRQQTLDAFSPEPVPFVDVLICTYNEPFHLLEMTMAGALNLDYPKDRFQVHICDDGRRDDLKALCAQYGVHYISRDDNEGAKAGNINHAIQVIQGDLFAVLDADMIPKEAFLKRTVGYFSNPNLAFVQTPQVYYNQDMYQYNLENRHIPNEQDFFMRDIQEARASRNAVLHVGTNAVFRRDFVLAIGGYPTCSITEDMAVGMRLQEEGYDSLLINEALVYGLSATTFGELVKQRDRWCRGNLQVLKKYNPLFAKGLNFSQKLAYVDGGVYWFSNLQKMVYMLCPLIYLFTGTLILDCRLDALFCVYVPFITAQIMVFKTLTPNTRSMLWAHYYETAMAPHLCLSIFKEMFNLKTRFMVTDKETVSDRRFFQTKIVLPHIILLILTLMAWGITGASLVITRHNLGAYVLNYFWSGYNLIGILTAIRVAWQKPIFRKSERVQLKTPIATEVRYRDQVLQGQMEDISGQGTRLTFGSTVPFHTTDSAQLIISEQPFDCEIVRTEDQAAAFRFCHPTPAQMRTIMAIFSENMHACYDVQKEQLYETA